MRVLLYRVVPCRHTKQANTNKTKNIPSNHLPKQIQKQVVAYPAYQSLYELALSIGYTLDRWAPKYVTSGTGDGASTGASGRFEFDVTELEALVTRAPCRLVVVNFPHNPTGATLARGDFERVAAACGRAGAHLFSDEMYWQSGARLRVEGVFRCYGLTWGDLEALRWNVLRPPNTHLIPDDPSTHPPNKQSPTKRCASRPQSPSTIKRSRCAASPNRGPCQACASVGW